MVPTLLNLTAVSLPDPHPPPGELDPDRKLLMIKVEIISPIWPDHSFVIAGETIPYLIKMLQTVCEKEPALTIERYEKECGVVSSADAAKADTPLLAPGSDRLQ